MLSFFPRRPGFWPAFLLLLSVLAGCRSEKVAFEFQPGPVGARPVASAGSPAAPTKLPVPPEKPAIVAEASGHHSRAGHSRPAQRPRPAISPRQARRLFATVLRPARQQPAQTQAAAQRAPADQGLGKIFWFAVLAVVLVLALLTWGIAALFGLGFWQALGWLGLGVLALLLIKGGIELLQ